MVTQNVVDDVVGAEALSFEDIEAQLAELQEIQEANAAAVKAHNEAQARIRELNDQKRAQIWNAWLDSAPEDLRETPEMTQLKAFVAAGFKGTTNSTRRSTSTRSTSGVRSPIDESDAPMYAAIVTGLRATGKEQKEIGKALADEFPEYYQNSESGAVVNHGTNVRTILIGKGKRWANLTGFGTEVDSYKDRSAADCETAYQSLLEKLDDDKRARVESIVAGNVSDTADDDTENDGDSEE